MPSLAFLSVTCPNIPVPCLCFHQCVTKSVLEEKHISKKKKITSSIESKSWHPRVYSGFSPAQSKLPLRGILTERLQSDKAAFKLKKKLTSKTCSCRMNVEQSLLYFIFKQATYFLGEKEEYRLKPLQKHRQQWWWWKGHVKNQNKLNQMFSLEHCHHLLCCWWLTRNGS